MDHAPTPARQLLAGPWTLAVDRPADDAPDGLRDRVFDAAVPGCVHADLVRAGAIMHPDDGFAELDQQWIGRSDWRYETRFEVDDALQRGGTVDLVCAALDTVATVELNGRRVGQAANVHHPHRYDVGAVLRDGPNELVVRLRGPVTHVEEEQARLGTRPFNGDWGAYPFIRKAACNFGWDWGPRVATAGILGPVELHAWDDARIRAVRPLVRSASAAAARIDLVVDVERRGGEGSTPEIQVELRAPDGTIVATGAALAAGGSAGLTLDVARPELWWPRGHGPQPLYRLVVRLGHAGRVLERREMRLGLRTVRLDTSTDSTGAAFTLEVNERPIFCRGANWIPNQLLPAPVDRAALCRRVEQAAAANMNMLRVWGGGQYEDDAFYERCDELGVLVWQDFMFACATYPEEDPYPALVEAEARHQVARLCRHPSVVLWCGGNENIWAHESWGFGAQLADGQTWGRRYWLDLLPALVAELDPTRPYWPDSPWSGAGVHPNDADHGDRHTWDVLVEEHRTVVPRFASELGHQGPPGIATLRDALEPADLAIGSKAMRHRQRATGGNAKWYDGPIGERFAPPRDFDEWHYLAQLLQARAIGLAIEWHRVNAPRCMGLLFWQLNDCWSGHSWSAIDVAGRRKPLWYAARRAFADRLLTIQPAADALAVFTVNDHGAPWAPVVTVRRLGFDGTVLATERVEPAAAARAVGRAVLSASLATPDDPSAELLVAEADGERSLWYFAHDRELAYPAPDLSVEVGRAGRHTVLHIRADALIRDLVIAADRLEKGATVDDQLLTLLPGETAELRIAADRPLDADALGCPPVLLCANRFGARRSEPGSLY